MNMVAATLAISGPRAAISAISAALAVACSAEAERRDVRVARAMPANWASTEGRTLGE